MTSETKPNIRLHPRLRVIENCDAYVAASKSELTSTIATSPKARPEETVESLTAAEPAAAGDAESETGLIAGGTSFAQVREDISQCRIEPRKRPREAMKRRPKRGEREDARDSYVNVFIEMQRNPLAKSGDVDADAVNRISSQIGNRLPHEDSGEPAGGLLPRRNFIAATVPVDMLAELAEDPAIAFVHPADSLRFDDPERREAARPTARSVGSAALHRNGEGVLVGIIDVQGFDFAHPDFLDDAGETRFIRIWDQAKGIRPSPANVPGINYGSEIRQEHMNAAIKAAKTRKLPATRLEPQSQMAPGSHGTHVASIAAGKSGVAPKADIAAVLISLPPADTDDFKRRRATFTDSSRIVHAIEYLNNLAESEGKQLSVNISLGTNGGAHDGSSGVSRWIDSLLATPGRSVCIAAGNAGQEAAESPDDTGYIMGRIHSTGRIPSRGLAIDLEWTVMGNGIEDMSENELEIWYGAQDRVTVLVKPPSPDAGWLEVKPQQFIENKRLKSGTTLSVYNELYHPVNGQNYISIYLSPNYDPVAYRGVEAGVWTVRLQGDEIRDGRFNCWIERDDPGVFRQEPGRKLYRFPSFFSVKSNVDSHSVNSLGCGNRVTCVANLDTSRWKMNISSSQGPTRDGRCKPDIAAPGTDIVAANGFGPSADRWVSMTGTSMASPYVAGVIALMLATNPKLTAAQCAGILQRTAKPLPGASYDWRNDAGFGAIEPEEAIKEAKTFDTRKEIR